MPRPRAELTPASVALQQVYLILDEFILGGELQESSKKVRGRGWEARQGAARILRERLAASRVPDALLPHPGCYNQVMLMRLQELEAIET